MGSFLQITHPLAAPPSSCAPWNVPKGVFSLRPHENLRVGIYRSFAHSCPNLDAAKMSFGRWTQKQRSIQTGEEYSR